MMPKIPQKKKISVLHVKLKKRYHPGKKIPVRKPSLFIFQYTDHNHWLEEAWQLQ